MAAPDQEPKNDKSKDTANEKTVILQRCAKHGTVFMPGESCPECDKEKKGSAG